MKSRFGVSLFGLLFLVGSGLWAQKAPAPGELATAVSAGNLSLIDELLLRGADPNQADSLGQTPLVYAVESGRFDLVDRILQSPVNLDRSGNTGMNPLMIAVEIGREDLVAMLLDAGANPNAIGDIDRPEGKEPVTPLSLSINRGEFSIARRLVGAGADGLFLGNPDETNPLDLPVLDVPLDLRLWQGLAAIRENSDSPDWEATTWALHRSARDGEWIQARDLIDSGSDPNLPDSRGVTPLMAAAWHGQRALVSLLLQRGARIEDTDDSGLDALSYAVAGGRDSVVDLLLPLTSPTTGEVLEESPYYWAVAAGYPGILDSLMEYHHPLPRPGAEGISLLMVASWLGDTYAVARLVALDTDPGIRDEAGRTALEWCAAAFDRDRRTGRETGQPSRGARNYPVARILARRTKDPEDYRSIPSPDVHEAVIEAWSPGRNPGMAMDWRDKLPSPVPIIPGDGDLTLYRIFRDEEPGEESL